MATGKIYENLFNFLHEVHKTGIKKGKRINPMGRDQSAYHYRSIDDIMPFVPNLLLKHDLAIRPVNIDYSYHENETPKVDMKGNQTFYADYIVKAEYVLYTRDGSETNSFKGLGQGDGKDAKHKGCSSALTNALKSFILTSLAGLPNGDNDEEDDTPQLNLEDLDKLIEIRLEFKYDAKHTCKTYDDAKKLWIESYYPRTTELDKPHDWTQSIQTILDGFPKTSESVVNV